jgi:hypothetical protein
MALNGVANDGYNITMPTRLGPENAEAVLGVVIGDASTRPASTSWIDGSDCGFMSTIASSISPLRARGPGSLADQLLEQARLGAATC